MIGDCNNSTLLLSRSELRAAWDGDVEGTVNAVESSFRSYMSGDVILPDKASQVFDQAVQNRINCMPSTVLPLGYSGVKWVSVFPENPAKRGLRNVGGVMVVSSILDGRTLAVMDASLLTSIRTAAVDALAVRYLGKSETCIVALVGTGEQAAFHARLLAPAGSGICVRVSGRNAEHADRLASVLYSEGVNAKSFGSSMAQAVDGADVIVTAISGQAPVLKAEWINGGALYCHVGGWEDEYSVPEKADMIVCDNWHALKHRGSPTIARMYKEGLITDGDIYADLGEIIVGNKPGRLSEDQFIYFNAIGLSFVDVSVAAWLLDKAHEKGLGSSFSFGD